LSRNEEPVGEALERELQAFLERNRADYAQPESYTLTHVFLRGDATRDAEARKLRATLEANASPPGQSVRYGDPFVTGSFVRATPRAGLVKMFGDAFTDAVTALEPGRWSEQIRSPYGLHLVWLAEKRAAGAPTLDDVRSQVLQAYRAERQSEYARRMMDEIRAAYEVRIEGEARVDG
jgi:parvulin-like peptidyl-prolyl isomerase